MPSKKPSAVKNAIIAKTCAGQSKTDIAKDLGITRNTVRRILNESEINQILEEGKAGILQLVPHATKKYGNKVKRDAAESKDLLERLGVLPSRKSDSGGGAEIRFTLGAFAEKALAQENGDGPSPKPN